MSNKLNLVVQFTAIDKLSNGLKNIVGLGRSGGQVLGQMKREAGALDKELGRVRRELSQGIASGAPGLTALIQRERELAAAAAHAATEIEKQNRLLSIQARTQAMVARGAELRQKGRDNIIGGAAMAAPLILAAKSAGEFSSGMVDIQQKADLSDAATARLANNITAAALAARQMPEDMRAGLDILLAKGMDVESATAAMQPAGRLATAFKVDVPDAADAAYASINNLKIAASETGRIFDTMAAAGNAGGFEVKDMARHFPALTAQMQALGDKGVPAVADLSAALQVAMHTAGNADQAGNNIKNLLSKINAPVTIAAFKKNFGVDLPAAMKKLTDQGYSSLEAIALITKEATGGDMKRLGSAFADQESNLAILALIQNLEEYRKVRAAALNSGGTVDRAFDQRVANDATVNWRAFMATASTLAITLGTTLLPALTEITGQLTAGVAAVSSWAQAHPEAAGLIMKLVGGLAMMRIGLGALQFAFGGLLGPVGKVWGFFSKVDGVSKAGTTFAALRPLLMGVGHAIFFIGRAMLLNPVGLVVTAIGIAAYLIYANWSKITGYFRQNWTTIRNILLGAMVVFTPWLAAIVLVASVVYRNWNNIKAWTMSMLSAVAGIVGPFIKPFVEIGAYLGGLVGKFFGFGKNLVMGLINGITSMAGSVISAILKLAGSIGAKFADAVGIESPSRLFLEYGRYITEGLSQGVDQGRGRAVRAVGRLATGVTAAGAVSLSPLAAAPVRAANGYVASRGAQAGTAIHIGNLTIRIDGAGKDSDQLAREIAEKLKRMAAVDQRSDYDDGD